MASFFERDWTLRDPVRQRWTLDELHHEIIRADIVERADIGVIQCGDGAGFPFEALAELRGRNLDGDIAPQPGITGLPHFAHAASANGGDDFIGA